MKEITEIITKNEFSEVTIFEYQFVSMTERKLYKNSTYINILVKDNNVFLDIFKSNHRNNKEIENSWLEYSINFTLLKEYLKWWEIFFNKIS